MSHSTHRLGALIESGLLDSPPTESMQRFVRIAQTGVGAPVILVSLVDDHRQFFANSVGLPSPWAEQRETPLSHSFCKHVVETQGPLIVSDAPSHPLVCANLAIRDLGVVAYAGFPIQTEDGHTVGSFCAIDSRPREWTERELLVLQELAAAVSAEFDLRRRLQRAVKSELALAQLNDDLLEGQARSVQAEKTFRHDLRSPLQVISLGMNAMLRSADFSNSPQLARSLALIERNVGHAISILNVMKYPDFEPQSPVAADTLVHDLIQNYQAVDTAIRLHSVRNDAVAIRIHPTNLRRCIENLLSNAIRFAHSRIDVSLRRDGPRAALTVEDDGPGLPTKEAYQEVWASGTTFHSDEGRSGTGLGLNIVQNLVERAGGSVSAGPSALGGARLSLWFPVAETST